MKIRAIITGATGMVGEGVLHECLLNDTVEKVLVINRKPCGIVHPKLEEILHNDFFDISSVENKLTDYNACFYCIGITSLSIKEEAYDRLTYQLTIYIAETLAALNPCMVFNYISGAGVYNDGKGKIMLLRIKAKTEKHLLLLPFRKAYMFRPAYIQPTKGLKNTQKIYAGVSWLYPLLRKLFPKYVCTLKEIGIAMINSVNIDYPKQRLEVRDIVALAKATA
jgi:nucleoside-diphosphate-sugar epimerase